LKGTANPQKTEPSGTKFLKFSNAHTNCSKRLQLEIKTIEFTSPDGSTFSFNIQTTSTGLTFRSVWFVFCKTILDPLRPPSPRTKSWNWSIHSLRKPGVRLS
jgi:hypothetical protein